MVNSYPLLLWVHITNAKVVLLQQTVVVADVVNKKLPFGLPLQKKHVYVSVRACLVLSCLTCALFTPIGLHVQKSIHSFQSLELGFQTLECNPQWEIRFHTVSHFIHTHTHTHTHKLQQKFIMPLGVFQIEFYVLFDLLFEIQKFLSIKM